MQVILFSSACNTHEARAQETWEECGRVITNPNQVEHLGATRATNNTGELSAVC